MQAVRHKQKTAVKTGWVFKAVKKYYIWCQCQHINNNIQSCKHSYANNEELITAEICWAAKVVQSNLSINSCSDLSSLFLEMFPDSDIAGSYSMTKTKLCYQLWYCNTFQNVAAWEIG